VIHLVAEHGETGEDTLLVVGGWLVAGNLRSSATNGKGTATEYVDGISQAEPGQW